MNTRTLCVLVASLLLTSGCVMQRLVQISTTRIEVERAGVNGQTAADALSVYRQVANHLGFVIEGPVSQPQGSSEVHFWAHGKDYPCVLEIVITDTSILYWVRYYGTAKNADADKLARLIEQELDKKGVPYRRTSIGSPFA